MKNLFTLSTLIFLISACGPSSQEKEEIAVLACNIMGESRNMDASFRIKEINNAREQIGEERFLGQDEEIKKSFEFNLCKELVLNDKEYEMKLLNALEEALKKNEEAIKKRTITYTNLDGNFVRRVEAANFDKSKISYDFICYPNGVAEGNYNTKFFQKNLFDGKSEDLFDEYLDPTWDNQLLYIESKYPQCYEEFTKNYEDNYFRDNL